MARKEKRLNPFFLFVLFLSAGLMAQPKQDFLVVLRPSAFSMLNSDELPLQGVAFPDGAPFLIIEQNGTLGDQVTPAARVSYLNHQYFLLKNADSTFVRARENRDFRLFKSCTAFMDTLENAGTAKILLFREYPEKGESFAVPKGAQLIRAFQYRDHYYLIRPSRPAQAGWIARSKAKGLSSPERSAAPDTALSVELKGKIISRVESANRAYREYFDYFNRMAGADKGAPFWRRAEQGGRLRFTFSGRPELFEGSTQALVRDLEGMLLGRAFEISASPGAITILPKSGGG
jgi:hypothetical protein